MVRSLSKAPLALMTNRAHPEIAPDTPLRLADAVKIVFPMGGMTVSGLRREIRRKRLTVEVMAGKQFTTLAAIEEMRRLCRVHAKDLGSGSGQSAAKMGGSLPPPSGLSRTAASISPRDALRSRLEKDRRPKPSEL
ncbi:Conserved hypothetical protein; putative excisionnase [Bradyrhizobium sp. ORS 285]|nr:putative excisionnase [Bradyrhizobium sp. ORS 285]SMX56650.1 Conserved hypothetical protein; putative excisionnase [Bradyrhizobium sp. ORS 285]